MNKVYVVLGVNGGVIGVYKDKEQAIICASECSQYYDERFKMEEHTLR